MTRATEPRLGLERLSHGNTASEGDLRDSKEAFSSGSEHDRPQYDELVIDLSRRYLAINPPQRGSLPLGLQESALENHPRGTQAHRF
jgi:hypothetical protein